MSSGTVCEPVRFCNTYSFSIHVHAMKRMYNIAVYQLYCSSLHNTLLACTCRLMYLALIVDFNLLVFATRICQSS